MSGWLRIDESQLRIRSQLAQWMGVGIRYTRSLPVKHVGGTPG